MGAKRIDGLLIERIDNELLVVNQATGEGHALNETAAAVFELCDGNTDRVAMLAALANFGLPADDAVLDLALSELSDAGLIAGDDVVEGINRRSVIRRLGLSVMAASALPLVDTMLARPASAQVPGGPPPAPTPTPSPSPSPPTSTPPTSTPPTSTPPTSTPPTTPP